MEICQANFASLRITRFVGRLLMSHEVNLLVSTKGLEALADMALATKEQARFEQLLLWVN